MSVELVYTADALEVHREAWDCLAGRALASNVFYESWMLLPALKQLAAKDIAVVLIWDLQRPDHLIGLFPLQSLSGFRRGLPFKHWLTWRHTYCYLGAPLIDRDQVLSCLEQVFAWCDQQKGLALTFSQLNDDALYQAIQSYCHTGKRYLNELDRHERALLDSDLSGAEYIEHALRKKKRKEFARLRRRLEESGIVHLHQYHSGHDDVRVWLDTFFKLEAQGWKGNAGTAIKLNDHEKAFVNSTVIAAAKTNRLLMYQLRLDEQAIASFIAFTSGGKGCFAFKIAYDEAFGQYSPGVLLMLDVTLMLQDQGKRIWVDSCAVPNHPMIDHIWRQRRLIVSPQISLKHCLSKPIFLAIRMVRFLRNVCN